MDDDQDTAAGRGPVDATEVVPPVTGAAPELAWSRAEAETEQWGPSWRPVWVRAALMVGVGVVLAGMIAVAGLMVLRGHQEGAAVSTPQTTVNSAPVSSSNPAPTSSNPPIAAPAPTVTVTPEIPPVQTPSTAELDQRFLSALSVGGLGIKNVDMAIQSGHDVCRALRDGHSKSQVEDAWVSTNKTFTMQNASTLVDASVAVYCPQFAD